MPLNIFGGLRRRKQKRLGDRVRQEAIGGSPFAIAQSQQQAAAGGTAGRKRRLLTRGSLVSALGLFAQATAQDYRQSFAGRAVREQGQGMLAESFRAALQDEGEDALAPRGLAGDISTDIFSSFERGRLDKRRTAVAERGAKSLEEAREELTTGRAASLAESKRQFDVSQPSDKDLETGRAKAAQDVRLAGLKGDIAAEQLKKLQGEGAPIDVRQSEPYRDFMLKAFSDLGDIDLAITVTNKAFGLDVQVFDPNAPRPTPGAEQDVDVPATTQRAVADPLAASVEAVEAGAGLVKKVLPFLGPTGPIAGINLAKSFIEGVVGRQEDVGNPLYRVVELSTGQAQSIRLSAESLARLNKSGLFEVQLQDRRK